MSKYISGVKGVNFSAGGPAVVTTTNDVEGVYTTATGNDARMKLNAKNTSGKSYVDFTRIGIDYSGKIDYDHTLEQFNIYTNQNATSKMTVLANGNVGINNTNPAYKLDVVGDIYTNGALRGASLVASGASQITGNLNMTSSKIINLATPTATTDAVNKTYVDTLVNNISSKNPVVAATAVAGALATDFTNGSIIDVVTLATGNRILIKNQADGIENGIYIVQASGAPIRSVDFTTGSSQGGSSVFVTSGTANADKLFECTNNSPTDIVGTDILVFTSFSGGGGGGSSDLTAVATHIVPTTNSTYDIGTTTKRFRNLYLAGNLISFANGLQIDTFDWSYLANYIIPPRVAASTDSIYLFDGPAVGHSAFIKNGLLYTFGNNSNGQLGLGDTTNRLIPTLVAGLTGVVQVACGDSFTIVMMGNGTLKSCGLNTNGQLGDGTTTQSTSFINVLNITTAISISCGFNFTLVLLANGTVFGFGSDSNGQLGNGAVNLAVNSIPIAMTMPPVVTANDLARFIDCGAYHSVVLLANGASYVCGDNTYGQLAVDPTLLTNANQLGVVPAISNVVSAAAGHYHTILITYSGSVITFGRNQGGQLGIGGVSAYNYIPSTIITQSGSLGLSTLAAAGFQHSGVIKGDNTIVMFGNNALGQLGLGYGVTQALTPTVLVGYAGYAISAGQNHTLIRTVPQNLTYTGYTTATIIGFGDNAYGQMGDNNLNIPIRYFPNNIFTSTVLKKIGGPQYSVNVLDTDGTSYTCGYNIYGQCGYPIVGASKVLKPVSRLNTRMTKAARVYGNMNLILANNGTVYAVGRGPNGELGIGTTLTNNEIPALTQGSISVKTVTVISRGPSEMALVDSAGQVWTAGYNGNGQLGNNTTSQSTTLINVNIFGSLNTKIQSVAISTVGHTIALSTDGKVHSWGYNSNGELGNNSTGASQLIPADRSANGSLNGRTIVMVAASQHSMALDSTGQVHTWGYNAFGALGNGTGTSSGIPNNISGNGSLNGVRVVSISSNSSGSIALDSAGVVHTWGLNNNGQLGNNTTTQSLIPINISSFGSLSGKTIIKISSSHSNPNAGSDSSAALDSTGQVHTWGYNGQSQLGNNTTTQSLVPINISSFGSLSGKTIVSITCGASTMAAIDSNGEVHIWGSAYLGNNTSSTSSIPINISTFGALAGKIATSIDLGQNSASVITSTGTLISWGSNGNGQLGVGSTSTPLIPTLNTVFDLTGRVIVDVAGGGNHNLAVDTLGKVHTWGYNSSGQLGNNLTSQSITPYSQNISSYGSLNGTGNIGIVGIQEFVSGYNHTMRTSITGQVYTWGLNTTGQLGNNTTTESLVPVNISSVGSLNGRTITAIDAGSGFSIALDSTGQVHTWGENGSGQLGNSTNTQSNIPINVSSFGSLSGKTITAVAASDYHSVALDSTGKVHAWGYGSNGALGTGGSTNVSTPQAVDITGVLSGKIITKIAAGPGAFTLAVDSTGKVYAWGNGTSGQLGNGGNGQSYTPIAISNSGPLLGVIITQIAAYPSNGMALSSTGQIYIWGDNSNYQLGNNTTTSSNVPINISSFGSLIGKTIVQVGSGKYNHIVALDSIGQVHVWGYNGAGQLGNNTLTTAQVPVNISSFGSLNGKFITRLSACFNHTIALDSTSGVHTWGYNSNGQLGNNTTNQSNIPITGNTYPSISSNISTGSLGTVTIINVEAGANHCMVLDSAGRVHTWGNGGNGQLGNSSTTQVSIPSNVNVYGSLIGKTITAISSYNVHCLALDSTGQVHAWGANSNGQLGNNTTTQSTIPINISTFGTLSGKTITAISTGDFHSVALDSTGAIHTWGYNGSGGLGNNTTTQSLVPINISTFGTLIGRTISTIAAIFRSTYALDSTGQVHAWGDNSQGQLGDNTTTNRLIPQYITLTTRDTHTQVLSKGLGYHKLFTDALNTGNLTQMYAAGSNTNRQIGDNTTTTRNNIVLATTFASNIVSTANSEFHSAAVLANGTVYTWGKNTNGQCGYNTSGADVGTPTIISGITTAVQVAVGVDFTLIRLVDFTILSCGNNAAGQLGVDPNSVASRFTPTLISSLTSIVNMACGGQSSLVYDNVGNCYTWGGNPNGKLGITSANGFEYTPTLVPAATLDNAKTIAVGVGLNHAAIICDNNKLYTAGLNLSGQLGRVTNFGTSTSNSTFVNATLSPIETKPVAIAAGDTHTIIQLANNQVIFFGSNANAQCPTNNSIAWTPTLLSNQFDIQSIKAGKKTSYLETDGVGGSSTSGPKVITYGLDRIFGRVAQVAGGGNHSLMLNALGQLYTSGYNAYGQLGNNTNTPAANNTPINISSFGSISGQTIIAVSGGQYHSMALDSIGRVNTWGRGAEGQLGNGGTSDQLIPINISTSGSLSGKTIVAIAGGEYHSIVLDSTGQVHTWGYNAFGGLGNNTTSQSNSPINISTFGSLSGKVIVKIANFASHSIALDSTGQVHTWGNNTHGQLGNNTTTNSLIPVNISSFGSLVGKTIVAIANGGSSTAYTSMALDSTGKVHTWGSNYYLNLGTNITERSLIPLDISNSGSLSGKTIVTISSGYTSIALDSIGGVHTWGYGLEGQLGNGTTSPSSIPVSVSAFGSLYGKTIIGIATGNNHLMALDSLSQIHTWGYNGLGQLGLGDTSPRTTAVQVSTTYIPTSLLPAFQNFTGQHRCFVKDINPLQLSNYEGLIVSSNNNKYKTLTGNNKITINESLPVVSLASKASDKAVFGVISMTTDNTSITQDVIKKYKESGDTRVEINSIGEGSLWVTDIGGTIEAGDYICSSIILGYGMRQVDDVQRNYTVAKATMDCDFTVNLIEDTRLRVDEFGNNVLDEYGDVIYDPIINTVTNPDGTITTSTQMCSFYDIRYLDIDGSRITEDEYTERKTAGESVYRGAFIGCTYHCG